MPSSLKRPGDFPPFFPNKNSRPSLPDDGPHKGLSHAAETPPKGALPSFAQLTAGMPEEDGYMTQHTGQPQARPPNQLPWLTSSQHTLKSLAAMVQPSTVGQQAQRPPAAPSQVGREATVLGASASAQASAAVGMSQASFVHTANLAAQTSRHTLVEQDHAVDQTAGGSSIRPKPRGKPGPKTPARDLQPLYDLGFDPAQVQQMLKRYGASGLVPALIDAVPVLLERGIGLGDIVKIASKNGATKALSAVIARGPALLLAGYEQADIVKIASNDGAAQALMALLDHGPALLRAGYNQADIVKIASNNGAAQALTALIKHGPALLQANFNQADIVKIASNNGTAQALTALLDHGPALLRAGYNQVDIVKVASNGGAAQALASLVQHRPALLGAGFTLVMLLNIAVTKGAAKKLALIIKHQAALKDHYQTPEVTMRQAADLSGVVFEAWIHQVTGH